MTVELIPVIEITHYDQEIKAPDKGPYWEYADEWEHYKQTCIKKAGFPDKLNSYHTGSSFYRLSDISHSNLIKLTKDETEEIRNGNCNRDEIPAFGGGYVLRINGQDKYFPQCCSDLSDIQYWDNLIFKKETFFYPGHPYPKVKIIDDIITFDFSIGESGEGFAPTPSEIIINIAIPSLRLAIEVARAELLLFSERLKQINTDERLNIENIDNILVWGINL